MLRTLRRNSISVPAVAILLCLAPLPGSAQGLSRVVGPPAPAAPPRIDSRGPVPGARDDTAEIRDRAGDARRTGQITRREERSVRRETWVHDGLADRFAVGGLSDSERRELEVRGAVMRDMLNAARSRPPK